jgi:hypothetical protein
LGAAQCHRKAASFCRTSLRIKARVSSEVVEEMVVRLTWPFSGSRRRKPRAAWRLLPLPPSQIITCSEARRARCQRAMTMAATSLVARQWFLAAHRRSLLRRPLPLRGGHRLQGWAAAYLATCVQTLLPVIRSLAAGSPPLAARALIQGPVGRRGLWGRALAVGWGEAPCLVARHPRRRLPTGTRGPAVEGVSWEQELAAVCLAAILAPLLLLFSNSRRQCSLSSASLVAPAPWGWDKVSPSSSSSSRHCLEACLPNPRRKVCLVRIPRVRGALRGSQV